jgi:hypothetical protein
MALAAEDLKEIEELLLASGGSNPLAALRQRFPDLFWTRCDASDMAEPPFLSAAGFDIHLLDHSGHCVEVTADPSRAGGVVIAVKGRRT